MHQIPIMNIWTTTAYSWSIAICDAAKDVIETYRLANAGTNDYPINATNPAVLSFDNGRRSPKIFTIVAVGYDIFFFFSSVDTLNRDELCKSEDFVRSICVSRTRTLSTSFHCGLLCATKTRYSGVHDIVKNKSINHYGRTYWIATHLHNCREVVSLRVLMLLRNHLLTIESSYWVDQLPRTACTACHRTRMSR